MTVKEAVLKSLEEIKGLTNYNEIYQYIVDNKLYDFGESKTPNLTVSSQLSYFIQKGDKRVKRIKNSNGSFSYYLSKYEDEIDLIEAVDNTPIISDKKRNKVFQERDLHKLLSSYLKNENIYAKTIFHEKSSNSKDNHQKWVHPDMIGIKFLNLKNKSSQSLLKIINKSDAFELVSYELKKEIKSDYELKKTYFQAVSNSSWANYGYLVAFDINDNLEEEMERLNQSFGIGIIKLKSNPFESEILFPARSKQLDFKTIDKLCQINKDFERFISQTESLLSASDKYFKATLKEFDDFCDDFFEKDSEIEKYCKEKYIPIENEKTV